jgi:hypothetical protein
VSIYRKWLLYHQCFRKLKGNHVLHTSHWWLSVILLNSYTRPDRNFQSKSCVS